MQVCRLWTEMSPELRFDSCVLDVYAEVKKPGFFVNLIEINPWGAHAGFGSLLFHWLDDADILNPTGSEPAPAVVIRLGEEGESPVPSRDEAYRIGRERIIEDELRCLRGRGLEWVLGASLVRRAAAALQSSSTTRESRVRLNTGHSPDLTSCLIGFFLPVKRRWHYSGYDGPFHWLKTSRLGLPLSAGIHLGSPRRSASPLVPLPDSSQTPSRSLLLRSCKLHTDGQGNVALYSSP
ncbi:hypothetical protein CKAH01_06373 [Colletotrichum kahawae]|uniref:Cell division cycle protein 123 n=1 Tax=Colletotrichum kahawae TaxID=34407 RepID=A0AAE0D3M7_COLKA|nr:hypothetical protein CKAH01_06373 [Colletotrichum kahawae]